jgi:von Willebrand factor type A C-terminal domain/von Willebrand factor type A domain
VTRFDAETYQNEFLPDDGHEVNAVITLTASDDASSGEPVAEAVEVILVDCSGSMAPAKIVAARSATRAAIEALRDGVWFAIIAGTESAKIVYPSPPDGAPLAECLTQAAPTSRDEARAAAKELRAKGGTAMGQWLSLADDLMSTRPEAIHHVILLTDGENYNEEEADFDAALAACEGHFQCDSRGVGTDWQVSELRKIATTLLGTVDIIPDPDDMVAEFRALTATAMARQIDDVSLRVWTPQGDSVRFLKQVSPAIEDLTTKRTHVDDRTADYPTGAWASESRDYHLCVDVQPLPVGRQKLAARVSVVVGNEPLEPKVETLVKAEWTEDLALSTRINKQVAHYTGQAELAQVIQEGLAARRSGDDATATAKLGRAVQLAADVGNDETTRLLEGVVEIDDAATGIVHLKENVEDVADMKLDTRSTTTTRVQRSAECRSGKHDACSGRGDDQPCRCSCHEGESPSAPVDAR